jgi:hypothetical protein
MKEMKMKLWVLGWTRQIGNRDDEKLQDYLLREMFHVQTFEPCYCESLIQLRYSAQEFVRATFILTKSVRSTLERCS